MAFPENFTWGAAAASYQIEGAAREDGRGDSIWDAMCRQPGKIAFGDSGEIGCNHYHHYQEDARLMAEIGLNAYRLSISWPRVLPEGTGRVNPKGLDFYDRLIDVLLEQGVEPWVTLFHWDYPLALFHRGGWLNPDSPGWFAGYTRIVVEKLADRVTHWMTLNEPQCFIDLGHRAGQHAPGLKLGFAEVLKAAHHSLLAHGKSVQVIRSVSGEKTKIGAAPVGIVKMPKYHSKKDIEFARNCTFAISEKNCWNNTWFSDPMLLGAYPEDGMKLFESDLPKIGADDMEIIHQPLDFYGVNIYFGDFAERKPDGSCRIAAWPAGIGRTTMGWPVTPEALYWGPKFLYDRYKVPIVITENGMANCDWIQNADKVQDPQRIDYLSRYLRSFHRAIREGVDGRGYFLWSIMDNFEWSQGFQKRFGLIYIDYATQRRILKDSARWYGEIISTNGRSLFDDQRE